MKLYAALFAWTLIWIPLAFCFQQNVHFPFMAHIAPVAGFLALLELQFSGNTFHEVVLPFLVFWGVVIAIIVGFVVRAKRGDGDRVITGPSRESDGH